jgi:hypothetical protein
VIKQGSIIRALVVDPRGQNPKLRPLVVTTASDEISKERPLVAVAITGALSNPIADDEIRLPFHPRGEASTGLRKPSVAKCSWLVKLQLDAVVEAKGFIPTKVLIQILEKIRQRDDTSKAN